MANNYYIVPHIESERENESYRNQNSGRPDLGYSKTKPEGWRKLSCVKCHTAIGLSISDSHAKCPFCYGELF